MRALVFSFSLVFALLANTFVANAQFEGKVYFKRTKGEKVTEFIYYVKGDRVRVEELDANGNVKGIMLVDSETNEVWSLNPGRMLYMDSYNNRRSLPIDPRITKTENTKTILGINCTEWIVRNESEGCEMRYWIGGDKFSFFRPMAETMNRKDKLARHYLSIEDLGPVYPIVGEELDLEGHVEVRLEVTRFEAEELEESLFEIPDGYSEFEK